MINDVSASIVEIIKIGEGEFFFVTHKPQLLPKYQNISFPFDIIVWSLLLASTVAMMAAMCIAYRAAQDKQIQKFKV